MQKTLTSGGHKQTSEMAWERSLKTGGRGKIILVKNPGKIKRVLVSFLSLAMFLGVSVVGNLSDAVYAEENIEIPEIKPVYTRNEKADFMITRIAPESSYFEMMYKKQNPNDGRKPVYVNLWYGDLTDYELYSLREGDVPGKQLIYKSTVNDLTFYNLVEGENISIWASRMAEGAHLAQNQSHQIDYVVIYDNGDAEHVRASYGRCVESSPYVNGLAYECLLEDAGNGKVRYQPYSAAGQRLEIPAEEDALLTARDETWRAVTGWPGEEVGGDKGNEGANSDVNSVINSKETAAPEEILVPMYSDSDVNSATDATVEAAADVMSTITGVITDTDAQSEGSSEALNDSFDQQISDNSSSDGDDVVVPNLSKETGQRANIMQPILYILGSTAAIFGWWFLFFGKRKNNKKGEEKSK